MCIHCNARGRHESRRTHSASWRSIYTRSELSFWKRGFYFSARKKLKGSPVVVSVATAKVEGRSWTGGEGCPLDPFDATDEPSGCSPSQAAIRRTMIVFNHQLGKFSHSCGVDSQTSVTRQASRQRKEPLLTEIDVNACEVRPPPAVISLCMTVMDGVPDKKTRRSSVTKKHRRCSRRKSSINIGY